MAPTIEPTTGEYPMAAAKRAVPVAVIASESPMKANTTMANTTIVGQPARMPLFVVLHDTFEAFLFCDQE
jgi:hypothetical protein